MSSSSPGVNLAELRSIVAVTCAAYDQNTEYYGRLTAGYDDYPGLRDEVLTFADSVPRGSTVLDLGCGCGRDTDLIARIGMRVVAGDRSAKMLMYAKKRFSTEAGRPGGFVQLDMLRLPFTSDAFGGVWACGSLLHLPSRAIATALREVWRVLRPGGVAAISMRQGTGEGWRTGGSIPDRRWFTFVRPETFQEMMTAEGFLLQKLDYSGRPGWFVVGAVKPT